ncbi:MAG: cell division ATP-binding protein FtsE [Gammaproteobacteria bacterium]
MIEFKKVTKRYANGHLALSEINFRINQGEMAFLTGHSGAGKSTVLKLIALLERCTRGQILINDYNINDIPERKIPLLRRAVGFIYQQPHLLPERTVYDNVALPLIIGAYTRHEVQRRVHAALDKVGLSKKEKYFPPALSCGEQQRVGIARAIVSKPPLLLADEPTGNLDPELSADMMRLFQQFNQAGVALLIASHDINLISTTNKRVITLKEGEIISDVGE